MILSFLEWVQEERGCSISTRNQRLAAIHAFFRYAQVQEPKYMIFYQKILLIPFKKSRQNFVSHLTPEQTKELLSLPNDGTKKGRRNMTLLSVLYDTGARVQELCDLRVRNLRIEAPAIITLTGKGRKTRHVPILTNTESLLQAYLTENNLLHNSKQDAPLFVNQHQEKLTRGGVNYILQKYVKMLSEKRKDLPRKITPHTLRHTKAMHLYQSGVSLIYIRDILGHADISTTDIYARSDTESKRKVLENAYPDITPNGCSELEWNSDQDLLDFLNNL